MEVKKHREHKPPLIWASMCWCSTMPRLLFHWDLAQNFGPQRQCVRAWDARPPAGGSPQQGLHWLPQPPHQQELPLPLSSLHSKSTICFQPNPNTPSILLAGFPTTFQKSKWACWPSLLLSSRPWQVMIRCISQHCLNTTKPNRGYTLPSGNSWWQPRQGPRLTLGQKQVGWGTWLWQPCFVWSWTVRWKG